MIRGGYMRKNGWMAGAAIVAVLAGVSGTLAAQVPAPGAPPALTGAGAPAADPVPVEAFAMLPALDSPKLSPEGTHIAAKVAIKGKQYLVIRSLFTNDPPVALVAAGDDDINWWRWVSDQWLAVGLGGTQTLYGDDYYITRTLGVSADMKTKRTIGQYEAGLRADDVVWTARDGSPRVLLSMQTGIEQTDQFYPSVFEADLSTGRMKRIVAGQRDVYDWYADAGGIVRAGYRMSDETGSRALLYRANADDRFHIVAQRRKSDAASFAAPLIFRADGSAVTIADDDGRDAVYAQTLPDLALGAKLFGIDGYDVDGVIAGEKGDDLAGVSVTDRTSHTVWLDATMREVQDALDKSVAPRRASIISWNRDRTRLLVSVGSPSQPGALYYYGLADGKMQRLAWQNDALKGRTLSPVSTIHYTARDGTKIEAVLTLPRGRPAKGLPLIVMPHGGPFARDSEEWDWWTQYLAESGYAVIQPNYRGSSGYGTAFAKLGEGQWGLKMQDDLDDAAQQMVKDGTADPKRMCMIGASYGGYAAMRAAQRGALYRCAVSFAGVSDLQAMRKYDGQFLFGKTRGEWLRKQAPDFKSVSPRFGAASFAMPILLVHGKADKRVPVAQSRLMADALKAAGKPYEYLEQPLADHHFSRTEDRLEFLKRMKAFLDRYNPA